MRFSSSIDTIVFTEISSLIMLFSTIAEGQNFAILEVQFLSMKIVLIGKILSYFISSLMLCRVVPVYLLAHCMRLLQRLRAVACVRMAKSPMILPLIGGPLEPLSMRWYLAVSLTGIGPKIIY